MKTILFGALALLAVSQARADIYEPGASQLEEGYGDLPITQVICHDTRNLRDEGITVTIQSGGFIGITQAIVAHDTIAGAQPLATVEVSRTEDPSRHPGLVAFNGATFRLVINKSEQVSGRHAARLKVKLGEKALTESLSCKFKN